MGPRVALLIDLPLESSGCTSSVAAMQHAAGAEGVDLTLDVIRTTDIAEALEDRPADGIFVGPGTPYTAPPAAEEAIRLAREKGLPLVGT